MGIQEYGTCKICGKQANLERTYFYFPIKCRCCGNGHFEYVAHCSNCKPKVPTEIKVELESYRGELYTAYIHGVEPSSIIGEYEQ